MNVSHVLSVVGLGLCLGACSATVGAGGMVSIPKDATNTCADHCASIGLSLDAVVIMANNVGCVCRSTKSAATDSSGASGGMAALIIQEQQRQAAQQVHH
jgi:hypothetical protein